MVMLQSPNVENVSKYLEKQNDFKSNKEIGMALGFRESFAGSAVSSALQALLKQECVIRKKIDKKICYKWISYV